MIKEAPTFEQISKDPKSAMIKLLGGILIVFLSMLSTLFYTTLTGKNKEVDEANTRASNCEKRNSEMANDHNAFQKELILIREKIKKTDSL